MESMLPATVAREGRMGSGKATRQPDIPHEAGSNPYVRQRPSRNSLHHEIEEIRRVCDELRLQVHLGGVEARHLWAELEERFDAAEARLRRAMGNSEETFDDVGDAIAETLGEIREDYARLWRQLAEGLSSERTWGRLRNAFDRLVDGGYEATDRFVHSFEELGDAGRLRVQKARLERNVLNKCAKLGGRVYELARKPAFPDGMPTQVLDDDEVKDLVAEIGSLDGALRRIRGELSERGPHDGGPQRVPQ